MSAATVERAALALAKEFGQELLFDGPDGEQFGADYWRNLARKALRAACERCEGEGVVTVPVGPRDSFGNQGTDEVPCPECGETP